MKQQIGQIKAQRPQTKLNLIIVIIDVGSISVWTGVPGASGGVLVIVMLTALVVGASLVHPVRQVSLQPLVREGGGGCERLKHNMKKHIQQ